MQCVWRLTISTTAPPPAVGAAAGVCHQHRVEHAIEVRGLASEGGIRMAEERQQQSVPQPQEQNQPPQGPQSTHELQRHEGGSQTGIARREGGLSSLFNLDPLEMLRSSPFALMRRLAEDMDQWFAQQGLGRGGRRLAPGGGLFAPAVEGCEREGTVILRADLPGSSEADVRVEMPDA